MLSPRGSGKLGSISSLPSISTCPLKMLASGGMLPWRSLRQRRARLLVPRSRLHGKEVDDEARERAKEQARGPPRMPSDAAHGVPLPGPSPPPPGRQDAQQGPIRWAPPLWLLVFFRVHRLAVAESLRRCRDASLAWRAPRLAGHSPGRGGLRSELGNARDPDR